MTDMIMIWLKEAITAVSDKDLAKMAQMILNELDKRATK